MAFHHPHCSALYQANPSEANFRLIFSNECSLMVPSNLISPFSKLLWYCLYQINQKFNKLVHSLLFLGLPSRPVFPSVLLHLSVTLSQLLIYHDPSVMF